MASNRQAFKVSKTTREQAARKGFAKTSGRFVLTDGQAKAINKNTRR